MDSIAGCFSTNFIDDEIAELVQMQLGATLWEKKPTFSSYLNNSLFVLPREEDTTLTQRLILEIETSEKKSVEEFISIRNKILSLISFAIKNNVNVEEQYLCDFDDSYLVADKIETYYIYWFYNQCWGQAISLTPVS